jgi:anaerobic magnesium-protoporphyrin IX monomethyl ester cyclase
MLFINPAQENFGGMLSRYVPVGVPVALGVLSAYLKKSGVKNIRIVDEEIQKITTENIVDFAKGLERPLVVGITVLTSQAGRSYEIGDMIREAFPDSTVIYGGIHVTALPNEPLDLGVADVVVRGEGEEVLKQVYYAIREGRDWRELNGVSYVDDDGKIVNNPDADLLENLDDVPMIPYELFDNPKYDMGFITSARGCPYKCSYCSQRILTGFTYRWHTTERILENLRVLIDDFKQTKIVFYDDTFSTNKKRVIDLCDGIVREGLNKKCSFSIQTRADNLYESIMPHLQRANFKTISLGMETGVERIADEIKKDETVQTHLDKIELCKKYDIDVCLGMIYGFPSESKSDREESHRVVQKADVGFVKYNNLVPYPGTPLYDQAKETGRLYIAPGWKNFNSTLSFTHSIFSTTPVPFVPDGTSEFELKRDIIRRNFQYYFQWKIIKKMLTGERGVGWVKLPPKWYLKPVEIFSLFNTAMVLFVNLSFSFLPLVFGETVYSFVERNQAITPPKDIKIKSRSFLRGRTSSYRLQTTKSTIKSPSYH